MEHSKEVDPTHTFEQSHGTSHGHDTLKDPTSTSTDFPDAPGTSLIDTMTAVLGIHGTEPGRSLPLPGTVPMIRLSRRPDDA